MRQSAKAIQEYFDRSDAEVKDFLAGQHLVKAMEQFNANVRNAAEWLRAKGHSQQTPDDPGLSK
jgi:hypothetical protein